MYPGYLTPPPAEMKSLSFVQGWDHYTQLFLLIGQVQARLVLERLFNYAAFDLMAHNRVIERLASGHEFNPKADINVEGVITVLGIDVHHLFITNDLFDKSDQHKPLYELVEIATERIIVRRIR